MHAEYVFLRMSGSTIICKTQYLVNIERRLAARSGAQVKRHKTNQNQRGAVYAAAIELPLALLSMWRRSLGDRSAIQGQRWLRQLASLHFQNRYLWTDLAPWRCRDHTTCIISVCAMTDPRVPSAAHNPFVLARNSVEIMNFRSKT